MDDAIEAITAEIASLLSADWRGDVAARLGDIWTRDRGRFAEEYCSVAWWGGSGSMADFIPDQQIRHRYVELLIELFKAAECAGYRCARAKSWVAVFERWLADGVV